AERLEALDLLFFNSEGFTCVGTWTDCSTAVDRVHASKPDVVLMDIRMPGVDGIQAVTALRAAFPDLRILMQTVIEDEEAIFNAIRAGADGYLLKQTRPQELLEGIRGVMGGGAPMTAVVARRVLKLVAGMGSTPFKKSQDDFDLTKREREILGLLVEGLSQRLIAERLGITPATVNTHVSHIYEKLQVRNVSSAVSLAVRKGLA
ncbi:MAG TPA: response regulator transcription factor, partial [Flavobacteriales bacterium]